MEGSLATSLELHEPDFWFLDYHIIFYIISSNYEELVLRNNEFFAQFSTKLLSIPRVMYFC